MEKSDVSKLQREIDAAIAAVLTKHGLNLMKNRAAYTENTVKVTLELHTTGHNPLSEDWKFYSEAYGLPVDALNKFVMFGGSKRRIVGFDARKRKMPIIIEDSTGRFQTTVEAIKKVIEKGYVL